MLVALGPGGTRELAERALEHVHHQVASIVGEIKTRAVFPTLGGTAEVCERLGVTKAWLGHVIAGRRPVPPVLTPEPLVTLTATPVWDLAQWDAWAERNQLLLPVVGRSAEEGDPFRD